MIKSLWELLDLVPNIAYSQSSDCGCRLTVVPQSNGALHILTHVCGPCVKAGREAMKRDAAEANAQLGLEMDGVVLGTRPVAPPGPTD